MFIARPSIILISTAGTGYLAVRPDVYSNS